MYIGHGIQNDDFLFNIIEPSNSCKENELKY